MRRRRPGIRPTSCFWTKPASRTICSDDSAAPRRGARVHDHAPCGRWQTSTFLAALRVTGLTAPGVFDGVIDGESFRAYIDQILVPTLHPGDLVIADNLGAHKVAGIQRAIQAAGATLWYLPPYSPDLNPIELCFAKLKALVRTARCRSTETLWPFLASAWRTSVRTNAATTFGTAATAVPHGHEKRFNGRDRRGMLAHTIEAPQDVQHRGLWRANAPRSSDVSTLAGASTCSVSPRASRTMPSRVASVSRAEAVIGRTPPNGRRMLVLALWARVPSSPEHGNKNPARQH